MSDSKNRRVLVVDDQQSIRDDFRKILGAGTEGEPSRGARTAFLGQEDERSQRQGFDIVTASQGAEAVEVLRAALDEGRPFAMAFVDVRMPPGIDGLEAIERLWRHDPDLQVVICTAYSDYSFDEIIERLGRSDRLLILKKPFDPVEVRQLAAALTEKWNGLRQVRAQIEDLREANARAESANRAKTEFLANMSHEIRTPMNALLGYVSLMCDPKATLEERLQYGRTIRKSGEHLLEILGDILDISSIEASRMVVNMADFTPFDLAYEVVSLMRVQANAKDLEISLRVDGAIPEVVESDHVRVRQILLNLVGNAIKFTKQGKIEVVLRLDENPDADHRYICFDVVDTGVGIEEEALERIFEPFGQADGSLTRDFGGTGLGLTIAKRLALLLGGDVEARSAQGGGSTFTLRLYAGELKRAILKRYDEDDCSLEQRSGQVETAAAELEDVTMEGRVLVVEDVKFNQLLVGALLRRAGAEVVLANDGEEGWKRAIEASRDGEPFDLILMDMQMPVMDGFEATRRLRQEGFRGPIVALTAQAMKGDRERCLEAGCDEYATKPLDKLALLQTCRNLLLLERTGAPLPSEEREPSERS